MSSIQINGETWELVDAEAMETPAVSPLESGQLPEFPANWRVFGPLGPETTKVAASSAESLVDADLRGLSAIPESLKVGDKLLKGRDAAMTGGRIYLDALFGGRQEGRQAYLMAELKLDADKELIFGAGCDWWMQWWIDGEPVFDTLATGNRAHPVTGANHCFRRRLKSGRHVLAVSVINSMSTWVLCAGFATPFEEMLSKQRSSSRWTFIKELQEIWPPQPAWQPNMAIRSDLCLADAAIELEYRQTSDAGNVGVVLGAQDSGHYYYAYVPVWGQLWRARGFWAAIAKADGSGYLRNLKMQLMPNVPCYFNIWRSLRVERLGNRIQMWVNGVKGPCAEDDTYGPGRVGIAGFATYKARNLKIDGKPAKATSWQQGDFRGQPWHHIEPDLSLGNYQQLGRLCKLSDDEIIVTLIIGRESSCFSLNDDNSALHFYRSNDRGRTWSRYGEPMAPSLAPRGHWIVIQPGVIRAFFFDLEKRCFVCRDSEDGAQTWSDPVQGTLLGDWERDVFYEKAWNVVFNLVGLRDGTLLAVILHGYEGMTDNIPNHGEGTWGTALAQPYCSLSNDRGMTWSEPVPMDDATLDLGAKPDSPCGGFSETAVAQLPSGKIVAVARPYSSPFMWQTESDDGGKTWRQACYAPFSGAGGPTMVASDSGYLALIKRGPGAGLHFSADEGVNWDDGTMIDYPSVFNGAAIEVEPDVVLVVYPQSMDEIRPSYARAQRIRLTVDGPIPDWQ